MSVGNLTQIKEVSGGSSYLSQNSLEVGFGVGSSSLIDVLEIRWPSGIVDVYQDVAVNQSMTVTEGETVPVFITDFAAAVGGRGIELAWEIAKGVVIGSPIGGIFNIGLFSYTEKQHQRLFKEKGTIVTFSNM